MDVASILDMGGVTVYLSLLLLADCVSLGGDCPIVGGRFPIGVLGVAGITKFSLSFSRLSPNLSSFDRLL